NADGSFAPESRRGTPTPWVSFCKITRLSVLLPKNKHFGRYYMQHLPIDQLSQIDIVSGAYMMISREIIEKTGLFDEDYFMYCEDTDLSYRMLLAGLHNYYLPSPILHYKGESTRKYSYSFFNTFYKAILLFFRKHYNGHISILRIIINIAICILGIGSFIRGKIRKTIYIIKKQFVSHPLRLLCLSDEANRYIIKEFSKKFDLQIIHFDYSCNSNSLAKAVEKYKPDYIVFDTSNTDYREILQISYNLPRYLKRQIATFYPEKKLIITSLHIFVL
ncbi:MAG: glycosyltransferase family 2 protein, partial [Bacteroidaceae bacterium]